MTSINDTLEELLGGEDGLPFGDIEYSVLIEPVFRIFILLLLLVRRLDIKIGKYAGYLCTKQAACQSTALAFVAYKVRAIFFFFVPYILQWPLPI